MRLEDDLEGRRERSISPLILLGFLAGMAGEFPGGCLIVLETGVLG